MFSLAPFSTTPYSSLIADILYAHSLLSTNAQIEPSTLVKFYESSQLDCFANLSSSLHPIRQINVYHIVYVTTNTDYNMTLNTVEESTLYAKQDVNLISYLDTESNYKLSTMIVGEFNMAVGNSSFDTTCYLTTSVDYVLYIKPSVDFILNTTKGYK